MTLKQFKEENDDNAKVQKLITKSHKYSRRESIH